MKIHVRIEQIVLDGVPLSWVDAPAVRLAVQRELTSMFSEPGATASWRSANVARVDGSPVHLSRTSGPRAIGRNIARSVGGVVKG